MVTFIFYDSLRPTLSSVSWEYILMYSLCARLIPLVNVALCIIAREPHLVVHLAPQGGASQQRVAVFDIKATRETNIPVGKLFWGV
jgi:hypothetical protein